MGERDILSRAQAVLRALERQFHRYPFSNPALHALLKQDEIVNDILSNSRVSPQTQAREENEDAATPQRSAESSARQRYGDEDHARRYGNYKAAHEIEKERRSKWNND